MTNSWLARRRSAAGRLRQARIHVAEAGGSTTTMPTRFAIAGGPGLGQFRDDGTLGTHCSVFNFNPYNYYQTPLERYNGTVLASLDVSEHAEVYSPFNYGKHQGRAADRAVRRLRHAPSSRRSQTRSSAPGAHADHRAARLGARPAPSNVAGVSEPRDTEPERLLFTTGTTTTATASSTRQTTSTSTYRRRTVEFGTALGELRQRDLPGAARPARR